MRLVHFSDTHLGFFEYARIDPETGLNQREQDFYRAWWKVVDDILSDPPDLVIHAGDLFHTPRPTNRAIRVASEGLKQIGEAGIPVVLISGNHSTPRIRATGSIFETLSLFPNVRAAFRGVYERFRVGNVAVHCVPHCATEEDMQAAFEAIELDAKAELNILVTHGSWQGRTAYSMGEFSEQRIPDVEALLDVRFDYIALGHYHRRVDVSDHASYSGSTERTSLNQRDAETGYLRVEWKAGELRREFVPVPSRPVHRVELRPTPDAGPSEILAALEREAAQTPEGAIVDLALLDIRRETYLKLDLREVDRLFEKALIVERSVQLRNDDSEERTAGEIGSLTEEFERFVVRRDMLPDDRQRLLKLGLEFLTAVTEEQGE
ncbi:MAG: exonuclease SbcCD subunit D [Calditrichaeota bacterium]|nr:exonuclease SbcCD subunit D [Calditrichota bacterium]